MMKIGKKNVIIVAMVAFCFIASLLIVVPIQSANIPCNYDVQVGMIKLSALGSWKTPQIFCGGYSRLSILLNVRSVSSLPANSEVKIYLTAITWYDIINSTTYSSSEKLSSSAFTFGTFNAVPIGQALYGANTFITETKAPYCTFTFSYNGTANLPANWSVTIDYAVYLRNE